MGAQFERYYPLIQSYLVSDEPNEDGEIRMRCPLHHDEHPSASVNVNKDVFNCLVCGGSSLRDLSYAMDELSTSGADVHDLDARRAKKTTVESLSLAKVAGWHEHLKGKPELMAYLLKRGLTKETIATYRIGYDSGLNSKGYPVNRYVIPVFDTDGKLVNLRRYRPEAPASQKILNAPGHGSPARLYPADNLKADHIVVCEGEWDALITTQHGIPAVTGTHGAKTWLPNWTDSFKGKTVVIIYDKDKEGKFGAKRAADALRKVAAAVTIVELPLKKVGADLTDWFVGGHTAEELLALINEAMPEAPAGQAALEAPATTVTVAESMNNDHVGKPLEMEAMVVGYRDPTHVVPKEARMLCDMKAGPKCKGCPMMQAEGESIVTIEAKEVDWIARFIGEAEDRRLELLRRKMAAVKCNRLTFELKSSFTIGEMSVRQGIHTDNGEAGDRTARRVYSVQSGRVRTNAPALFRGTVIPNPKDGENEFMAWELEEVETSIDKFRMTPALRKALAVFQPLEGQGPIERMRDIANDLSANVTRIIGRQRLHMAMDLVWHSVLRFRHEGKMINRGWLELLIVGDTRTGKSETALRLLDHYRLGQLVNCEMTSLPGLVGGVQQIRNAWTITWGALPLNDRRLVVLDEFNGLRPEDISLLSDIRSRGIAQITKVESSATDARVRAIYISNPRSQNAHLGVDKIEELVGSPEDIARFDFAMSVSTEDVLGDMINSRERPVVPHVFTSELCHQLILWAWSRKPSNVRITDEAQDTIYEYARKLGNRYSETPPLVQRANVREKVARLAVAVAARTFSTDEAGEALVVRAEHVLGAARFLDRLYSYEKFGYQRISQRDKDNRRRAELSRDVVRKWLMEHRRITEFLLENRTSFKTNDLVETTDMAVEEARGATGFLYDHKMLTKIKGSFHRTEPLVEILTGIDKEQRHK